MKDDTADSDLHLVMKLKKRWHDDTTWTGCMLQLSQIKRVRLRLVKLQLVIEMTAWDSNFA